jgi:hypothetical protein
MNTNPTGVAAQLRSHPSRGRSTRETRPDPREDADAGYREAYGPRPFGKPLRRPYYQFLPEAPAGRFVSRDQAAAYLAEIDRVLDMQQWTAREQEGLRRLRVRWAARASGKDARFAAVGVQGGVNDRFRRRGPQDIINAIYQAIRESREKLDGARPDNPQTKWVVDPKWPMGRPNPHRR